jgi:hypothetical protein
MSTIAKVLIAAALAVAGGVGGGVTLAQASNGSDDPAGHVRGPCDEAEHAGDPRCAGTAAGAQTRAKASDDRQHGRRHRGRSQGKSSSDDRGSNRSRSNSGRG